MNFAAESEKDHKLFMECVDTDDKPSDSWFIDNNCLNHMTTTKSLFKKLDEAQKIKMHLGDEREILATKGRCRLGAKARRK